VLGDLDDAKASATRPMRLADGSRRLVRLDDPRLHEAEVAVPGAERPEHALACERAARLALRQLARRFLPHLHLSVASLPTGHKIDRPGFRFVIFSGSYWGSIRRTGSLDIAPQASTEHLGSLHFTLRTVRWGRRASAPPGNRQIEILREIVLRYLNETVAA
jgi:hypothetical protein